MQEADQAISENKTLKAAAQAVVGLLLVLLAGSVVYYKQRMLFIDAPHIFFRVASDGQMHIEEHRIGSFITQLVPLLGSWLHLPFRLLLILYSASFYLFYLSVALLLVYAFRNYGLALLFGLYLTLFVSDTYYWPNNEVHQGIAWLMLAFAVNFYAASRKAPLLFSIPLFAVSFYLAIWTHPLVALVAIFLWFFFLAGKKSWPFSKAETVVDTAVLFSLGVLKYFQGSHSGYDSTKMELVTHFQLAKVRQLFAAPMLHFFVDGCTTNYWLLPLVLVSGIIGLIKQKKYLIVLWVVGFALAYLALVCITFWDVSTDRFYIESEYMPLAIICCAPFVYFVLPRLSSKVCFISVTLIFVIRLGYIGHAARPFTDRVAIMDNMINKMKEKNLTKVIIPEPVPGIDSALIMNWGAPVESIFLSKLKGDNPQRTFVFVSGDVTRYANLGKDTLLSSWEKRTNKNINTYYFQVDTTATYQVMSYSSLME